MKASRVAVGVIVLALGGLWYAGGGPQQPLAAAGQLRVSGPVSHDNLSVFFVHGPDTLDDARVVTLQEALERGWAVVHETGTVDTLAVENLSADHELFLQSGDIVKGGRQDRLIASDLLVPPRSGQVPVPSHCVEQGRWAGRGGEAATHFTRSDNFAIGKELKLANADRNQGGVWQNVAANQQKLSATVGAPVNAAASPTSLQLALENAAVKAKVSDYEAALKASGAGRPGVVGAVFVVNGKVSGAEVYGSGGLFRKAWPKLLGAAAAEAIADRPAGGKNPPAPSARDMADFLAQASQPHPTRGFGDAADPAAADRDAVVQQAAIVETRSGRVMAGGGDHSGLIIQGNEVIGNRVILNQLDTAALSNVVPNLNPSNPDAQRLSARGENTAPQRFRNWNEAGREANASPVARPAGRSVTAQTAAANPTPGNRLNVNMVDNPTVRYTEARDTARPGAVIHRSFIGK